MNILYEPLPEFVVVQGKRYRIQTDFREWIKLSELAADDEVPWQVKQKLFMQWYIDMPDNAEEAIYALGEFLAAKEMYLSEKYGDGQEKKAAEEKEPVFSFQEDAGCIYSAFFECYGIDLLSVKKLHWWKFKMLFEGLPDHTEIKQRIMYRKMDLNTIKDKEEKRRVKKIKKEIALHKKKTVMSDYEIGEMFR